MSEKKKEIILSKTCCYNGRHYPPDSIQKWPESIADELIEKDAAEPVMDVRTDRDPNRREKIIFAALDAIDNGDTIESGAPNIRAMEEILGFDITAEERDHAWETIKNEQKGD